MCIKLEIKQVKTDNVFKRNIEVFRETMVAVKEKTMDITYSRCLFVALGIQYAMRMCHIAICDLPRCTIFFSTLSHKRYIFGKVLENKICVSSYLFKFV